MGNKTSINAEVASAASAGVACTSIEAASAADTSTEAANAASAEVANSNAEAASAASDEVASINAKTHPKRTNNVAMLAVLYAGGFIAAFCENNVNVALISIMGEFSITAGIAQWLVTGYMMITSLTICTTAFLLKRFSLRGLYMFASAVILSGSLACFVAPSFALLLVARVFQAVGTGIFIPAMMSTVIRLAPKEKMGTYLSIGACMITFGPALAPSVSGLMVVTFGWRSVFLPPAACAFVLALAGLFCIRNVYEQEIIAIDFTSLALAAAGLFAFVYGLSIITSTPMLAAVLALAGLMLIAAFARRQTCINNPLLNLEPLRNPRFAPVCLLVIVAMMTSFSMSVLLPLYYEGAVGISSLAAGLLLLPPVIINSITTVFGGRTVDKRGPWPLLAVGFAIIVVGQLLMHELSVIAAWLPVFATSVIVYAGIGLVFSPSQTAGLQTLPQQQSAHGVSILNTLIQVAASIGPSLFVGILSSASAKATDAGVTAQLAQAAGFTQAIGVAACIAAFGCVVAFVYTRFRKAHG